MCGIAGMVFSENSPVLVDKVDKIRDVITNLLVEISSRGTSATGIATMNDKGNIEIYKKPDPAKDFIRKSFYTKFLEENINKQTRGVLLHARAQTKGSKEFNENNHPVMFGEWVVVHNGMVSNDDELFKEFNIKKPAEVDTVAIPMVCHLFLKDVKKDLTNANSKIKEALEKLSGSFTFGAMSPKFPDNIFLVKRFNPAFYLNDYNMEVCIFASEGAMISRSLDKVELKRIKRDAKSLNEGSIVRFSSCDNYINITELAGMSSQNRFGFVSASRHWML